MTALFAFGRILWQLKWVFLAIGVLWGAVHWHQKSAQETINAEVYKNVYRHVYALEEKRVKQELADAAELARLKALSEKVTERVVVEYRDRVRVVKEKGETIIKETIRYVTPENDAACTINRGFVSMWNNANTGTIPGAPGRADGEASEVRLSEVAAQHARESEQCRATEVQLESLQDWVRSQSAVQ